MDVPYNFGALPMPDGYSVIWHESHEHYQGHGPGEWETEITASPHQARLWCVVHAAQSPSAPSPAGRR